MPDAVAAGVADQLNVFTFVVAVTETVCPTATCVAEAVKLIELGSAALLQANKMAAADRNNNGVIDSIDDALSLIEDLEAKGYTKETDIKYLELQEGRHDVPTWASAFPDFLKWGWGYVDKTLSD